MNGLDSRQRSGFSRLAIIALCAMVGLASACQTSSDGTAESRRAAREIKSVPWDQAEVTRLSADLLKQTSAVRTALRQDPSFQDQARVQSKPAFRLMETMKVLEKSTRQLATRTEKGGGLEETLPVVRKLGSLLRSARVDARSLMLGAPLVEAIEQARETLRALSPFYGTQLDPAESSA